MALLLGNGRLSLVVDPDDGGRVRSLRCEVHGREWLDQGPAEASRHAFDASRSAGWDELFPTVAPGERAPAPWAAPLRDHGELWGRPWEVDEADGGRVVLRWTDPGGRYSFARSLALREAEVVARYRVVNHGDVALPWMWAMHPVLRAEPGDRIVLPGVDRVRATLAVGPDGPRGDGQLAWPADLDIVPAHDDISVYKLYARTRHAAIHGGGCALSFAAHDLADHMGLYLNYGGWPRAGSPLHQVGLEPTTAGADDLADAERIGQGRVLAPGAAAAWQVTIALD